MKIYIAHSSNFDFQQKLYQPLKMSSLYEKYEIILPHEDSLDPTLSKKIIESCDLVLAEVSYPSTGMGIELGWANAAGVSIIAIHDEVRKISSSLQLICDKIYGYNSINKGLQSIIAQLHIP